MEHGFPMFEKKQIIAIHTPQKKRDKKNHHHTFFPVVVFSIFNSFFSFQAGQQMENQSDTRNSMTDGGPKMTDGGPKMTDGGRAMTDGGLQKHQL